MNRIVLSRISLPELRDVWTLSIVVSEFGGQVYEHAEAHVTADAGQQAGETSSFTPVVMFERSCKGHLDDSYCPKGQVTNLGWSLHPFDDATYEGSAYRALEVLRRYLAINDIHSGRVGLEEFVRKLTSSILLSFTWRISRVIR